jgi:hypothetical protein
MNTIENLAGEIRRARNEFINNMDGVTEQQSHWKPDPSVWNIVEITEHLFWAEHGAIVGMWKTLHAIRNGERERTCESIYKNFPIQQIIDLTWKEKEIVPAVAAPRMGGPLRFWKISFHSLQQLLEAFCEDLQEDELRLQAHPHPISGPLDFQQRLEFIRFHIDRHAKQVSELVLLMNCAGIS